jgi:hypothetical protein
MTPVAQTRDLTALWQETITGEKLYRLRSESCGHTKTPQVTPSPIDQSPATHLRFHDREW